MTKLVLLDAFATLIRPRRPVFQQYTEVFQPHFRLDASRIKDSFKLALKTLQKEKPMYVHTKGVEGWWGEVIRATAIGAGANPEAVDHALPVVVPQLLRRFSSKEGYAAYPESLSTLQSLKARGLALGVVSNSDSRLRGVLRDLGILDMLDVCLISEEAGVEKPNSEIWMQAISQSGSEADPSSTIHVGDELEVDYYGAEKAGLKALLIRRPGLLGDHEGREVDERLRGLHVIQSLDQIESHL